MLINSDRPAGERHLRGEGPRERRFAGGVGRWPVYDEGAADYYVSLSMTSIMRLRMMSYLCVAGPMRIPALAKALEVPAISLRAAMWGLKSTWMVEGRPVAIRSRRSRSRAGGCYAMEWEATEEGRKWLWRFAWVTQRIWFFPDWSWPGKGFQYRFDLAPYNVLRDYAEPSFLRPAALAIVRCLVDWGPVQGPRIAEVLGFKRSMVEQYIKRWRSRGWLTKRAGSISGRSYFAPDCVQAAPKWEFNREGEAAIERHVDALRWAAQTCGYIPYEDDPYLQGEDMVGYSTAVFYSVGGLRVEY